MIKGKLKLLILKMMLLELRFIMYKLFIYKFWFLLSVRVGMNRIHIKDLFFSIAGFPGLLVSLMLFWTKKIVSFQLIIINDNMNKKSYLITIKKHELNYYLQVILLKNHFVFFKVSFLTCPITERF